MFKGLFEWYLRRKQRKEQEKAITNEMREQGLEVRRMNSQIRSLEKRLQLKEHLAGLQDAVAQLSGDDGDSKQFEKMVLPLIMGFLAKGQQQPQQQQEQLFQYGYNNPTNPQVNAGKNQIIAEQLKKKIPKEYLSTIQELSDADIIDIKQRLI